MYGVGFEWRRTPPAEWQEQLDDEFNVHSNLSRLVIRWEPGNPWAPVQRWNLFQILPPHRDPENLLLPMLRGPSPREFVYWDPHLERAVRKRGAPMVSLSQWQAFREFGGIPFRFWTLQGHPESGGHKTRYNRVEQLVSKLKGGTREPPVNGTLPPIQFGENVMNKLRMIDRIRMNTLAIDHYFQNADQYDRREEEAVERMMDEVWKFIGDKVQERLDRLTRAQLFEAAGLDEPIRSFGGI